MPFELGIDYACRIFGSDGLKTKSILVLGEVQYDYQKALSDISGWDIRVHGGSYQEAIRHVRDWLVLKANASRLPASKILSKYADFQVWHWKREKDAGASDQDIKLYPTPELIREMLEWANVSSVRVPGTSANQLTRSNRELSESST